MAREFGSFLCFSLCSGNQIPIECDWERGEVWTEGKGAGFEDKKKKKRVLLILLLLPFSHVLQLLGWEP